MGQEFFIKSENLETKIRTLLPSQGGLGAGFDLSASTQIVPIVDLTESAEGSNFRQDLQTALSFDSATAFATTNSIDDIVTNTGYFKITCGIRINGAAYAIIQVTDGATTKALYSFEGYSGATFVFPFEIVVFNPAGYTVQTRSTGTATSLLGSVRQIATIDGELVNP
jgi:hypothetical protein